MSAWYTCSDLPGWPQEAAVVMGGKQLVSYSVLKQKNKCLLAPFEMRIGAIARASQVGVCSSGGPEEGSFLALNTQVITLPSPNSEGEDVDHVGLFYELLAQMCNHPVS